MTADARPPAARARRPRPPRGAARRAPAATPSRACSTTTAPPRRASATRSSLQRARRRRLARPSRTRSARDAWATPSASTGRSASSRRRARSCSAAMRGGRRTGARPRRVPRRPSPTAAAAPRRQRRLSRGDRGVLARDTACRQSSSTPASSSAPGRPAGRPIGVAYSPRLRRLPALRPRRAARAAVVRALRRPDDAVCGLRRRRQRPLPGARGRPRLRARPSRRAVRG